MIRIWSQFIGTFLIIALGGAMTGAYFNDIEFANGNSFGAFKLDAGLVGAGIEANICSVGAEEEMLFTVDNLGGLPFEYELQSAITQNTGSVCDSAHLTARLNDALVYEGSIAGLGSGLFELPSGEQDAWSLTVSYPATSSPLSGVCGFDVNVLANQLTFMTGEAFYDVEGVTSTIAAEGSLCGPTVDLRMDKHISGETNGFSVDQFSYHIVGDGIDAIVPHGGIIALPIGMYTIEELVPDGFEKDDWRIGWYGECERGSTFTTTITIDDGNIDHGVLDCQADNQYRPGHGDNEPEGEESEVVTSVIFEEENQTETTQSLREGRETRTGRGGTTSGSETQEDPGEPEVAGLSIEGEPSEEAPEEVVEDEEPVPDESSEVEKQENEVVPEVVNETTENPVEKESEEELPTQETTEEVTEGTLEENADDTETEEETKTEPEAAFDPPADKAPETATETEEVL